MLNWNSRKNAYTSGFLLFFAAVGGVWTALYISTIVQFKATSVIDAAIFVYWLLPTILAILCLVALKFKQLAIVVLWISAGFWLIVSGGELIEGDAIKPNVVLIMLAFALAVASLAHLVAIKIVKK